MPEPLGTRSFHWSKGTSIPPLLPPGLHRPSPASRWVSATSTATSSRLARPRPRITTPPPLPSKTWTCSRWCLARLTRGWDRRSASVNSGEPARPDAARTTSTPSSTRPSRRPKAARKRGLIGAARVPSARWSRTHSSGAELAMTACALKPTTAIARPGGAGSTSTEPSAAGKVPRAASSRTVASGCSLGAIERQAKRGRSAAKPLRARRLARGRRSRPTSRARGRSPTSWRRRRGSSRSGRSYPGFRPGCR